jgi:hypothetical protein
MSKRVSFDDIQYETINHIHSSGADYDVSVPDHLSDSVKNELVTDIGNFYHKQGAKKYEDFFNGNKVIDSDIRRPDFSLMSEAKNTRLDGSRYEYKHSDYDKTHDDEADGMINYLANLKSRGFVPYVSKTQMGISDLSNSDVHKALKDQTTWNSTTKTYEKKDQSGGAFANFNVNGKNFTNKALLGGVSNRRGQFLVPVKKTNKITSPTGRHMVNSNITGQVGDIILSTKSKNSGDNVLARRESSGMDILDLPSNRSAAINSDPNFVKSFIYNVRGVNKSSGGKVNPSVKKGKFLFQYGLSSQNVTREIPETKDKSKGKVKEYWDELESEVDKPSFKVEDYVSSKFEKYADLKTTSTGTDVYEIIEPDSGSKITYNANDIAKDKNVENWKKMLFTHHFMGETSPQSINDIDDWRMNPNVSNNSTPVVSTMNNKPPKRNNNPNKFPPKF